MNKEHTHRKYQDTHVSTGTDHWIPISLDITKVAMLLSDTVPKSWKEAMAAYDTAEWMEGLREEMASLWAHDVFTLIPK